MLIYVDDAILCLPSATLCVLKIHEATTHTRTTISSQRSGRARRAFRTIVGGVSCTAVVAAAPAGARADDPLLAEIDHAFAFAAARLDAANASIASNRYPNWTGTTGAWSTTDATAWTSGFFPGSLWLLYDRTGDASWKAAAESRLVALEGQKYDTSTHDVGFKILSSFGNGQRLTGSDAYRQVVLTAAGSLATRYSATVGAIKSWNGPTSSDFRVIIDNMMNLEILFWGARNGGDPAWYTMAVTHALTTRQQHVRSDGSTYQVVNFDPATGQVKSKTTHQGLDDESTWSRGQAWAVYGFTMCYRETGDTRFLDTARQASDYFVAHLPADFVPFWDFELPSTAGEPRDSSAAAVAAAGLLELSQLDPDSTRSESYLNTARAILTSLSSSAYLAEGTSNAAILQHATQNRLAGNYDTGLVYGDYYFLEAMLRYLPEPEMLMTLGMGFALLVALRAPNRGTQVRARSSSKQSCEPVSAGTGRPPGRSSWFPAAMGPLRKVDHARSHQRSNERQQILDCKTKVRHHGVSSR